MTTLQELGASDIDAKLAPTQFCDRLCLVKTSPNIDFSFTPGRAGRLDQTVSMNKLWPALKFKTYYELIGQLKTDDANVIGRIKGKFTVAANRLVKQAGISLSMAGFAYLLGKGTQSSDFLILLKKNDSGDLMDDGTIFDFFDHMLEMESGEGYCSSTEFQHAFKIAIARMEMAEVMIEESGEIVPVHVTTVNSARKTFDSAVHLRVQSEYALQQVKAVKEAPRRSSPRKKIDHHDLPVETVVFSGKETSDTSTFGVEEEGELVERINIHATQVAGGFTSLWESLREQGWDWLRGGGLVDWYYVSPSFAHLNKTELFKTGELGKDFFDSEESVERYAAKHLGFSGIVTTPGSERNESKDRAYQRRDRKRSASVAVTTDAPAETKKKEKRKKIVEKKKAIETKGKKKKTQVRMSSNVNAAVDDDDDDDDDGSHFSLTGSPTVSEAEADLGVKLAQRSIRTNEGLKKLNHSSAKGNNYATSEANAESESQESASTDSDSESNKAGNEDKTFQVLGSEDAWKLLMDHFGFKYHKGMYCLPGKENKPGKDSSAVEGRHYFSSLMELRKNLCAYGLPECKNFLCHSGVVALDRWVRFANVKGLPDAAYVNPADVGGYLNFNSAWTMLVKLGMRFTGGFYIVDDPDPSKDAKKFENEKDFSAHLARFGIPHINSPTNVGLTDDDRLRLDIFVASTDVNSFKRIDPDKENVNEITPRRSRSKRSSDDAAAAAAGFNNAEYLLELSAPSEPKQALNHKKYQMSFNNLQLQRQIDLSQIDSKKASEILTVYYDIHQSICDEGNTYYCFPGTKPSDGFKLGVDFFESIQDMREYLCAYGLPPKVKHTKLSESDIEVLDQWIRSAHIKEPYDEFATGIDKMSHMEVKSILKGLGYVFNQRFSFYLLPNTSCHRSQVGKDRFVKLIDLFNHISRFGLSSNDGVVSASELQRLQLLIASVATNDLSHRIECREPLPKQAPIALMKNRPVVRNQSELKQDVSGMDMKTPKQVPVVLEEEDTPEPHQTPPKKKNPGILNYFAKTVADGVTSVMKAALTPSNHHSARSNFEMNASLQHETNKAIMLNSISSNLENLSPSCVDKKMEDDIKESFKEAAQPDEKTVEFSLSPSEIDLPWAELWKEMRKSGWTYMPGNELSVAYYYIHPKCRDMTKKEVLGGVKGRDYFESEEDVRQFAKEHLGWKGVKEYSTPGKELMSFFDVSVSSNKRNEVPAGSPSKKPRTQSYPTVEKVTKTPKKSLEHRSKEPSSESSKQSITSSKSDKSQISHIPLPDQYLTYKDKLEYCKMTLHPSYFPKDERLSTTSNSTVEQLESEIKNFIMRSMETGYEIDGLSAQSPGFMYICGGPGTGKTTAVTACSRQLMKWAKDRGLPRPCYCHINMASNASMNTGGIMKQMLKSMAKKLQTDNNSELAVFKKKISKKGMILVVDEIDMLFKNQGGSGEEWFSTLIEWCEDKDLPFSMIGISNSVNDVNATKIRDLAHCPQELVFPTYTEADLLTMLEKRIGKKIVDTKALQLISKRVSASSGDARKALEITSNAIDKALDAIDEERRQEEVEDDSVYPLVKLPHMMRAIREGMPTRHEEIIRGLPRDAKVILCIAVSLGKVWGPNAAVSIGALKKYAVQATQHSMFEETGLGQIKNLVEMLMDSGLLTGCVDFDANNPNSRLHIGVQLDDVEIALEKSLLAENGFYNGLVEYVKRECPCPE